LGVAGALLGWGVADPSKHTPPPACYGTEFGWCRSNHVVIRSGPKNFSDARVQGLG